jgi:hypothetical protein
MNIELGRNWGKKKKKRLATAPARLIFQAPQAS